MNLRFGKVFIRNASVQDAPLLAAWWNDGVVMAHAGFPQGLGTTAAAVARSLEADTDDTMRHLILLYDDLPIGEMYFRKLTGGTAEIGIKICEAHYQNRGIGRIALSLLIRQLFAAGYQQIVLDTNLKNTRAQHVYEKIGFQKVRVNLNSWVNQLGETESSVDYTMTKESFVDFAV